MATNVNGVIKVMAIVMLSQGDRESVDRDSGDGDSHDGDSGDGDRDGPKG